LPQLLDAPSFARIARMIEPVWPDAAEATYF
jgi:hypothetical protein